MVVETHTEHLETPVKSPYDISTFTSPPSISEEETNCFTIYGFNCCGRIIEFPDLRGLTYGKKQRHTPSKIL